MDFEHKVRKSIKKATKTGLEIEIDSKGSRLDDFLKMYYGTMDRSNAKENFYFKEDFFQIINEMTNQYVYFHVLYEGQVISTELVIYGTENCYSFLGGTNREFFHLNANSLLKFEIIKWAKEKGLKRFILGGGYGADDGIYKYKKSFAPNGVYDFYVGKKIFDREKYNELVKIRSKEEEFNPGTSFFPLYRG
nr:GNAT family N-acetyltransferase [Ammoniphilus resinae]